MKKLFLLASLFGLSSIAQATAPQTLFELSGLQKPKVDFNNSVLIIIDAQQEYTKGKLPLFGVNEATQNIKKLLERAREKHIPVIHVLHEGSAGGLFDPNGIGYKSIPEVAPRANELIVVKHFPNAFADTTLAKELEKFGKDKSLVIVGFMTNMCVSSTASAALDHGFTNLIVRDAVATRDLRGADGKIISAKSVNEASLASLQDRIGWIVDSKELLK